MTALYPLKFTSIFKDYLWGGNKLQTVLQKDIPGETAAESWEVSAVPDNVSVVSDGPLKGLSLQYLIDTYGADLVGKRVFEHFGREFPILIKFIDAAKDLSVQLHPNDQLARERHQSFGKTEMWYVMQSDPGAQLIVGFKETLSKEAYLDHLKSGKLLDILHTEKVHEGDTFFISTGKVHAIGAGILLAEIQQTSNITYRIYDYNRKDKDGKERELHTELAVDAIDYEHKDDFRVSYNRTRQNTVEPMVECPYFITNYIKLQGGEISTSHSADSFSIYLCVYGEGTLHVGEYTVTMRKGESVLVPASLTGVRLGGDQATFLEVHL